VGIALRRSADAPYMRRLQYPLPSPSLSIEDGAGLHKLLGKCTPEEHAIPAMARTFKSGDHVAWNSEAGRVRGIILKKVVSNVRFKGYVRHATRHEPQYFIKSDKTEHLAIHKGSALRLLKSRPKKKTKKGVKRRTKRR
jgi:hypothetical protein